MTASLTWLRVCLAAWPAWQQAWLSASSVTLVSGGSRRHAARTPRRSRARSGASTGTLLTHLCATRRANAQQPKLFVGMILILIFAEALALYGLIGESRRGRHTEHVLYEHAPCWRVLYRSVQAAWPGA